MFYLESLATLVDIIARAGFRVRIGSLLPDLKEPLTVELPSGRRLLLEPIERDGNRVRVGDFSPCSILLNNDLSGGKPPVLEGLEQPVIPPLDLGWHNRLKSNHFAHYRRVAFDVAELLNIDPWLIDPMFRKCGEINFKIREGEECVAKNVDALLTDIRRKYAEYGVEKEPFVIVKADAGTYGMGIMTVRDPQEIFELNRKERTKMSASKEGQAITKVIVQEGVYTFETWGEENAVADDAMDGGGRATQGAVAEPVVYMMDRYVVGGFYRVHKNKGVDENLNAPGMQFEPLAFATPLNVPDKSKDPDAEPNRFYSYGVVGRLAMLAAAREIAEAKK
jgi:glutamate--cysteine ligase